MRKTGRPLGSGYDDTAAIGKILSLMQEEGATRRSAIIRVCGLQQLRRIEMKMAARGRPRNGGAGYMGMDDNGFGGHSIGVDHDGATVVLAPNEIAGSIVALGGDRARFLLDLADSMIGAGSGLMYVDGKGDPSLRTRISGLAAAHGRGDDVRIVDFTARDGGSCALNPFSTGTAAELSRLCMALMDDAGENEPIWWGRALAMLGSVMQALVWKRDHAGLELNVGTVRDHLALYRIVELAIDEALPADIRNAIVGYTSQIPKFDLSRGTRQAQLTMEQHGHLYMQFSKVLTIAADVYGSIFTTPFGQIDMTDVVLNRRILIVTLPSVEKTWLVTQNLGRIILATLRHTMNRMHAELCGKPAGTEPDHSGDRATRFVAIMDEVGSYQVEGLADMAEAARILGYCLVFADGDLEGMPPTRRSLPASLATRCAVRIDIDGTGGIDLVQGDRLRRLKPMHAHA